MLNVVSFSAQEQLFINARSVNAFTGQPVSFDQLRAIYDLCKWGPTSMNCQPMRLVFVTSPQGKEKLRACLSPGNIEKTMAAPVTAIVAMDVAFFDKLPTLTPIPNAREMFADNADKAQSAAMRNSWLQAAYFIIAARAQGLDAGPMGGFNADAVNAAFFADTTIKANMLVNLGYGDASANYPRGPRLDFDDVATVV